MSGDTGSKIPRAEYTLGEIAREIGAVLQGDPERRVSGIAGIEEAGPDQLGFLADPRYAPVAAKSRAAALIVSPASTDLPQPLLICEKPYLGFALAASLFSTPPSLAEGIHPTAVVDPAATIGEEVRVGPLAQIGAGTSVGPRTRIYGGTYIGSNCKIGEDCLLFPGVHILDRIEMGNRIIIHSGTVVGSDGFGYAADESGRHHKIPQTGTVEIEDDVEIGSNCSIDRATFGRTRIGTGTKIDNLVQIAHNVTIGRHSILVAQVGISGSTRIGNHVILAGQVGIVGHISIGDRVRIGAKSGVIHSIKDGEDHAGYPAFPHREWLKSVANVKRLAQMRDELKQLRTRIQRIEATIDEE